MATVAESEVEIRELDQRRSDGIDVRLLWNPHTERVWVDVRDERSGTSFEIEVDPREAPIAFQHPYAFAA